MIGDRRPARLRVEAGKVAEFRAAVGLPPDESVTVAPPTFPAVLEHFGPPIASMLADRGIDLGRVLHGEEDVRYEHGPLRVGDDLSGTIELVDVRDTVGRSGPLQVVTFRVRLWDGDGRLAVTIERKLVITCADI